MLIDELKDILLLFITGKSNSTLDIQYTDDDFKLKKWWTEFFRIQIEDNMSDLIADLH